MIKLAKLSDEEIEHIKLIASLECDDIECNHCICNRKNDLCIKSIAIQLLEKVKDNCI